MSDFDSQVVVVTGGASGQGAAEAKRFATAGAHVVIADLAEDEGRMTVHEIEEADGTASFHHLDVAEVTSWAAFTQSLVESGLGVNVLVNNAGLVHGERSLMTSALEDWDRVMGVNLYGSLLGMRHIAPLIRDSGGGAIVNIGSSAALTGHTSASYATSKWALRGLTKSAAIELRPWRIRVNAVHPGLVHTAMVADAPTFVHALERETPLGRGAEADEVASAVVWLASAEASFVAGIDLVVDGGLSDLGPFYGIAKALQDDEPHPVPPDQATRQQN